MKVLVVGGGIGGLGAAIALADRGVEVDVVEKKASFSVYGVGINVPANGLRALRSLGLLDEVLSAGFQFGHADFYDGDGEFIVHVPSAPDPDVPANNALSRVDLHRALIGATERRRVKIHYGTTVQSFNDRGDLVDVRLSDGRSERYDLVAAFDGIHSPTRRRLFGPKYDATYTGFGVFRITLPRPADIIGIRVYQAPGAKAGFCPLSAETMYMFLVTGDPAGTVHNPARFQEILRERMTRFADDSLPGQVRDGLGAGSAAIVWSPISDITLPLPWFRGRVGVLGDAAHACAPHTSQGAAMALEDAVVLAEELTGQESVEERLERFQQRRYPRVKLVQDLSYAILAAEMSIDETNRRDAYAGMRKHLPAQSQQTDRMLNAPA
ncbi:FAD-dependent monooxygenase [Amycolatopsis pithecellobii]|uniref:NAD(P)-binding protein n=1 Tax=Amycolatopsis pithecellobii TaxID=664692 RepID=A0A6N7YTZ8_9PSEU|nr:FAD-dependent monooxygenase [Amycolatopsis pithecellobii]MTD56527.1 NAD(P)-binding protein [Amycolatopsis pithecellobii]